MNEMTATEVRARQREMQPMIAAELAQFQDAMKPYHKMFWCFASLGFCKRTNRSPKKLARLKHSLTMTHLNKPTILFNA